MERARSNPFTANDLSAETLGSSGKSSYGTVFMEAEADKVCTFNNSPEIAAVTVFPRAFPKKPANTEAGTATTPSDCIFAGIVISIPHSRFVARAVKRFPSALSRTLPKTGRLARFSANLAAVEIIERSSGVWHSNFILYLEDYYY